MNPSPRVLLSGFLLSALACHAAAQTAPPTPSPGPTAPVAPAVEMRNPETPAQHEARMAWWREAKFGMFIHWGLYAIPADGEWHMRAHQMPLADYKKYAAEFNPTKFDADQWAALAHDAGMKYLVLTTKHHDGFAMFHSQASAYNVYDATPFHRDPLQELSVACPKHDVKLGTYYSVIADWGHPGGGAGCPKWDPAQVGSMDDYINNVSVPQVKELLTNYGPIAVMWFDSDGAQAQNPAQVARFAPVLKLQPPLIVDPRLHGMPGDFETAEAHIPMKAPTGDWELCTRTNGNWGYTHAPARPLRSLLREASEAWGKGGNVLLNVGPTAEGIIPPDSAERLREIGAWLKTNGAAIYGSERGPFDYLPWGWTTRKGDMLYLLVADWPKDGVLKLPTNAALDDARLLASPGATVPVQAGGGETIFTLPAAAPDPDVSVVAVRVKGALKPYESLLLHHALTASEDSKRAQVLVNGQPGDWRIAGQTGTLEVDLGAGEPCAVLRLSLPYTSVAKLKLEASVDGEWKTVVAEEKPKGTEWTKTFPAVTAQKLRLSVEADKPGIRVAVFEVFPPL